MSDSPLTTETCYRYLCQALSGAPDAGVNWTPADWERFAHLAQAEGVAPLLYAAWKQAGFPAGLPAAPRARFQQAYFHSAGRNSLYLQELHEIAERFAQEGIACLPLKGAALAEALYPDPATRPMSDLDLLVRPEELRRALALLRRLGYSLENFTYHAILWGPAPVELHWSLPYPQQPRRQPPEPWFWRKQTSSGPELGCDALLLHGIVHLQVQNSGQGRLLSYLDLLRLAQAMGPGYDWPGLQAQASEFGWGEAYSAALQGVAQRFPGQLPAAALPSLPAGASLPPAQPQHTPRGTPGASPRDRYTAAAWRHLDLPTRLQAALSLLFPGRRYIHWRYHPHPAWLWPLCYPLRWAGLVRGLKA